MGDILVRLVGRRLGATLHVDGEGTPRVIVPDRALQYYLDLTCGQLRRYSRGEPSVLIALLRMLRDVANAAPENGQRAELQAAAQLVTAQLCPDVLDEDRSDVEDMFRRVELAVAGDTTAAFADRVGETRSI